MRNLIYVNMMRLKKSRIFRAGVAVSMAYVAFLLFMNYQEAADTPETVIRQLNWNRILEKLWNKPASKN